MTGRWELDDGQSLCYVESDDASAPAPRVPQPCITVSTQNSFVDGLELLADVSDFTATECHPTELLRSAPNDFDHVLSNVEPPCTATGLNSGIDRAFIPSHDSNYSEIQPTSDDITRFELIPRPLESSNSGTSRKRSLEGCIGPQISSNEPEIRKRRSSSKQMILQPACKIDIIDRTFLSPLAGINLVMGFNTRLPNSRFDSYIHALRQLIRCSAEKSTLGNNLKRALTAEGVLWAVRESWPSAEGYWNLTATFKGFLHAELWRNFPCERTYRQLPPEYRPTRAQLMVPHSPMIDWMPWPDLRDLAIRNQDTIDTDELFRMAILNVVAHRKRLAASPPVWFPSSLDKKSFRVWDLVCLEKSNGVNPLAEPGLTRKPVLHSPSARALVRAFDLEYDEFATQKLDDCFFEAFPALWCDTAASSWTVEAFPTILPEDVGYPVDLTSSAVHRLKSKFETMIGSVLEV